MPEETVPSIFDNLQDPFARPRKKMLPSWIKFFAWMFLVMGIVAPIVIVMGLMGWPATISLFGFSTNEPFSFTGIVLTLVYILKAATGYGLVTQKNWAVKLALVDGIISLLLCILHLLGGGAVSTEASGSFTFNRINLEIVIIIPYIYKMWKIKDEWEANTYAVQQHVPHS